MKRLLVVEDDPSILMGLRLNLQAEGYDVVTAEDGETALAQAKEGIALVILDLMLPGLNGFEVLRRLRREKVDVPVIILSARNAEEDKVRGLEIGAEDYVTKPFSLAELLARIRVVLRRTGNAEVQPTQETWRFGEVTVNAATREVFRNDAPVELTRTEFDVLEALYRAGGEVLSRDDIFEAVWGPNHHGTRRTVDNFVAQLRSKLERDPADPDHLITVRGVGYRFAK